MQSSPRWWALSSDAEQEQSPVSGGGGDRTVHGRATLAMADAKMRHKTTDPCCGD
jgi:hypothetical protein